MKKINIKILLILVLIVIIIPLNIFPDEKNNIKPQKVILIIPDNTLYTSAEKQIIEETESVLEKLDSEIKIVYIKKRKWQQYENLLEDLNNKENIGKFFIKSDVSGIININIDDKVDKDIIKLFFYNIIKDEKYLEEFAVYKGNRLEDLGRYFKFLEEKILKYNPGLDLIKIKKEKIKQRVWLRKNPTYEINLSGGLGYYSRQSSGADIFSNGFTGYLRLETKVYNFAIDLYSEFTPLFNNADHHENKETFLYNTYFSMNLGGWLLNQSFRLGIGGAINIGDYYVEKKYNDDNNGDYERLERWNVMLIFPYLNFSFLPVRSFQITLNIGAFFSPTYINTVRISSYFPLYVHMIFKYFIYKKLFIEISVPFYMIDFIRDSERSNDGGGEPSFQGMINLGIGWRFEWYRK